MDGIIIDCFARIGNSVVPVMAQKLVEANCSDLIADQKAAG